MRRYYPILNPLGLIILIFSLLMGVPLSVSWFHADNALGAYDESILITFAFGLVLWATTRKRKRDLRIRDGFLLVVLTWVALPLFAALPLWLYLPDMSFTDAYFEATSGLTATGATVMSGLDNLPISINFWRTFLHWIGGMGVIVLAVAILPLLGIGGRQMLKAEIPGPMKESSLTPRIAETAKGLWVVYLLLTVACAAGLNAAGMEFWDALMHAFSVMGLGGFSTKDASLGHFNSVPIELVAMFFALLSGINFATHFIALRQRSLKAYLHDPELPFYFGVLAVSILALSLYLSSFSVYDGFANTLRYVAFHTISLSTSLGFATSDYTFWPMFAQLWI
ncbi:TrkH family potassium uptake protein, partial [Denitromonas sp.]|uniref:TrkH family potassium uptake protein n=1 Tax=Denitromonas sp. TaxID=2734609 RepID=UPI003A88E5F7